MSQTISFRATEKDTQIIERTLRPGERKSDVIRRALRLLDRDEWLQQSLRDMKRLRDEDLSQEPDAW